MRALVSTWWRVALVVALAHLFTAAHAQPQGQGLRAEASASDEWKLSDWRRSSTMLRQTPPPESLREPAAVREDSLEPPRAQASREVRTPTQARRTQPQPQPRPVAPPPERVEASAPKNMSAMRETPAGAQVTRSFHDLGSPQEPLRLNTWQASYTVKLPLSPREAMSDAMLHLDTVNSTALIRSRSELSVRVNGRVLAQYALDPERTRMYRDIPIPMELLKPGFNDVEIGVVQHYTYDCEDPASPELWTEIDPLRSGITLNFKGYRPNLNPRLTQLHTAFDRRGWVPRRLSVISGTETLHDGTLAAAATVVQGLGLRLEYRPLAVDVFTAHAAQALQRGAGRLPGLAPNLYHGKDVLLIGKRADLSRYIDGEVYSLMSGAFVGVFSANDGDSVVLVVSGETDEQLMQAARSVADPDFKFSDTALEQVLTKVPFRRPQMAEVGKDAAFSNFGYRTTTSRGIKVQPLTLEFRVPADYGARKGDLLPMQLHFSYGAGLRRDSAMTISLNGNFAVSVPLNEPKGAEFTKYEVRLPAQFLRPGYNRLTFEPVFIAQKDRCDMLRDEHMALTVYEDSTLELPRPTAAPVVPDLERFRHGFWPLDDKLRVYLTSNEPMVAGALLEFVSMLAQKNRAPFDVELAYSPFEQGHMLVMGTHSGLADYVAKALPLQKYSWHAAGSHAAIMQSLEGKRVVTAFLARDSAVLKDAIHALNAKGLWNSVSGAAVVIDTEEKAIRVEPAVQTEVFGLRQQATVSFNDWRWYAGGAAALAALFALSFVALLRRRALARQRALADEEQ